LAVVIALGIGGLVLIFAKSTAGPAATTVAFLLAVAAIPLFRRLNVAKVTEGLKELGAVLPLIAYLSFALLVEPRAGTVGFDEISAQVIVVLLLALAIDARFFRLRAGGHWLDVAATFWTLVMLGAGEYYALDAVFTHHPKHQGDVAGAIAAGFVAVAVAALVRPGAGIGETTDPDR
jgi:hypothetical protein